MKSWWSADVRPAALAPALAWIAAAVVFGWCASGLLLAWLRDPGYLPLGAAACLLVLFALVSGAAAFRGLRDRHRYALVFTDGGFTIGGVEIERAGVTSVRHHSSWLFKGVRVELVFRRHLDIPAHIHEPHILLASFRAHHYPIGDAASTDHTDG